MGEKNAPCGERLFVVVPGIYDFAVTRRLDARHDQVQQFARVAVLGHVGVVPAQLRGDAAEAGNLYVGTHDCIMHEEILHNRELGRREFRLRIRALAVELCVNLLLEFCEIPSNRLGVPFGGEQSRQIDLAGGIAQIVCLVLLLLVC